MKRSRSLVEIAEEFDRVTHDPTLSKKERQRRADELLEEAKPQAVLLIHRGFERFILFLDNVGTLFLGRKWGKS